MSFKIRFEIDQLQRFGRALAEVAPRAIKDAIENWTGRVLRMAVQVAQGLVPVRRGFLRASIYAQKSGFARWEFGASMHYAGFVEGGTRFMAARPYMRPAMNMVRERFSREIVPEVVDQFLGAVRS